MSSTILIPIDEILIEDRQREDMGDIDSLASSIFHRGLLQPIVVEERQGLQPGDPPYRLVAGHRRLLAVTSMGWSRIDARPLSSLSDDERVAIELEENIKRKDLVWQEYCKAVVTFHRVHQRLNPDWTQDATAKELGITLLHVSQAMQLEEVLATHATNPSKASGVIAAQPTISRAYRNLRKTRNREATTAVHNFIYGDDEEEEPDDDTTEDEEGRPKGPEGQKTPKAEPPKFSVLNADFFRWLDDFNGRPFNFLHLDPPYGISRYDRSTTASVGSRVTYSDSEDLYFTFLGAICAHLPKLLMPTSHIILWFPMLHYCDTLTLLTKGLDTYDPMIERYPLVWHKSDNAGLPIGADRRPRRVYETALFISLGDARIENQFSNACYLPTNRQRTHISEKPMEVLQSFFRIILSEDTEILDPCCGSGTSIASAKVLGAKRGLGIELDQEAALAARHLVETS